MDWVRGDAVGRGSFATVSLAIPKTHPGRFPLTAVKSSEANTSRWLKNEKHVLDRLGSCPRIVRCFGHDYTLENGVEFYNLFLEYAAAGTLADEVKRRGGRIAEPAVRHHARSIVEGLNHVHQKGFVHCDVKLQNILVFEDGEIKIADFGLAKEAGEEQSRSECRGTPMFMSPEQVIAGECGPAADIWALGCAVVEMVTGKPAWQVEKGSSMWSLLLRIGAGEEVPGIPENLSDEGKDFIGKCFIKDPRKRWSAEMLLAHPFVSEDTVSFKHFHESPRSHFEFPDWVSSATESQSPWNFHESCLDSLCSPENRLRRLVTVQTPAGWSESDGWSSVR
ncbi:mitogen-activated protein kinase kinase kinase 17 [Cajanus cajan]|uniref:Mitogen-activated protein kinase kinase kinase A n=1 Tax=Cajanus cajan TaxID=3821 RepID=A0A151RSN4_CAJCA|nr:mitogen-activated protein kinase kinase kinase 17 [Cajanus cajan]KYP45541.1 Mitogen-activated protein kinase kinase kinase A [Cajanus cajan]